MTLAEAREPLLRAGWRPGQRASEDLDDEGGRQLSKLVADKLGHQFIFITDYPVSARPFYHMRRPDDPMVTCSFDLIWNGLEVTTGAQREHRHNVLVAQAAEKGIALEPIRHYVECFRYGCPPYGGFGIGVNRLLMKLLDLRSMREATLLFRGPNRLPLARSSLAGPVAGVRWRWFNAVLGSARRCWWPAFVCANTST